MISRYKGPINYEPLDRDLILDCLRQANVESVGLSNIPTVMKEIIRRSGLPNCIGAVHEMLYDLDREGVIELQPEAGLNRLSKEDLQICPPGPQGSKLTWARFR